MLGYEGLKLPPYYVASVSYNITKQNLVGGFKPSEKYESQLGLLFPIYGKKGNVPNH